MLFISRWSSFTLVSAKEEQTGQRDTDGEEMVVEPRESLQGREKADSRALS